MIYITLRFALGGMNSTEQQGSTVLSEETAQELIRKIGELQQALAQKAEEDTSEWVSATRFREMVGLESRSALTYYIRKGVFRSNAIRNIGAGHRNTYRFHRYHAVAQFLNQNGGRGPRHRQDYPHGL